MAADTQYTCDENLVARVRKELPQDKYVARLSTFFKAIGDPTRVKIIFALSKEELCVNDLAAALDMTQSAVSHQLKLLRMENHVRVRREGKNMYYALDDEHVMDIIAEALTHVRHKLQEK